MSRGGAVMGRELRGRHFLDLNQARTLPTPGLVATGMAVADLVGAGAMRVVHGLAGTGKTFAVETSLAGNADMSVCWAAFPSRPTMRPVAASLFEALSGLHAGDRTRFRLTDQLIELLMAGPGGSPRVLVVDEAQRLTRECIELLRHLHDHPATHFTLVLVGGDGTWEVLSRESRTTGRPVRPCSTAFATATVARALGPCVAGPGRVALVIDPDDSAEVSRSAGAAYRAAGRFVVHASPGQGGVARLQAEVLMALGKHWDRASEHGDAAGAQLVSAWLRAEGARELTVLRAHQVHGAALRWLLGLAGSEGLLLRLVSPEPLGKLICDGPGVVVEAEVQTVASRGRGRHDGGPRCDREHTGPCEDLNCPAPLPPTGPPRMALATARRLRRLYDIEAAALATATVLLGRFDPRSVASPGRGSAPMPPASPPPKEPTSLSPTTPGHCCADGAAGNCSRRTGPTTSLPPT